MSVNNLPVDIQSSDEKLNTQLTDLSKKIVDETSVQETQNLVDLFNWALAKKNALRLQKFSELYDKITDQMLERFEKRSGEFSNVDLLNYLQSVESSMDKAQKNLTNQQTPSITVQNNTQVNLNVVDTLDEDSKNRIADAIRELLSASSSNNNQIIDTEFDENENVNSVDKPDEHEFEIPIIHTDET